MDNITTVLQDLARKFGLLDRLEELGEPAVTPLVREALERASSRIRCTSCATKAERTECERFRSEPRLMVLCREYLKLLCGKTLLEDTTAAARQSVSEARAGSDDSLEWYEQVQKMLSPTTSPDGDPGAYFDPRSWEVDQIRAGNNQPDRFVRLALFVEAMLDQEEGLLQAGAKIQDAAERVVEDRQRWEKPAWVPRIVAPRAADVEAAEPAGAEEEPSVWSGIPKRFPH